MKSTKSNKTLLRQIKIFLFSGLLFLSCHEPSAENDKSEKIAAQPGLKPQPGITNREDSIVFQTENLVIRKLSNHIFEHQSFLATKDFGKVECNGMIVVNDNEAIIFDTPADNQSSQELVNYADKVKWNIKAVIATHFHEDCVGGLETFRKYSIPEYASNQTIKLLKIKGNKFSETLKGFDNKLTMEAGNKKVYAEYFGEGHTKDNIVGYFPEDRAVFGGCLIKETGATKGNLEDANVSLWPATVRKLKQTYPDAQIVIPGHGKTGGTELFDYTIKLFDNN